MLIRQALALSLVVSFLGAGCSTPGVLKPRTSKDLAAAVPKRGDSDPGYRVAAGDAVEVRRAGVKKEVAEVRTDGSVQLAGVSIRVDDLTPPEIACRIRERLGDDYRDCKVNVAKYNSQYIYVFGDGREDGPRAVPYQGKESLPAFITRVGFRECLRGYRARVVRASQDMGGKPDVIAVRLDAKLEDREQGAAPVYLKPNDYVYLERDGAGPGGMLPRSAKFWPMTKFTLWSWNKNKPPETAGRTAERADRDG